MIELTPEIFNLFCNNILRYREVINLEGDHLDYLLYAYNNLGDKVTLVWHIQEKMVADKKCYYLWKRKAWLTDIERRKKIEADREEYNEVLEERKRVFREICQGISDMVGMEPNHPMTIKMAEKAMAKRSTTTGELLGINWEKVRELPKPHLILDEEGNYKV